MSIEPHYTKKEAAELLKMSIHTLNHKISGREITVVNTGRVLIPESALKAYLKKNEKRALT